MHQGIEPHSGQAVSAAIPLRSYPHARHWDGSRRHARGQAAAAAPAPATSGIHSGTYTMTSPGYLVTNGLSDQSLVAGLYPYAEKPGAAYIRAFPVFDAAAWSIPPMRFPENEGEL